MMEMPKEAPESAPAPEAAPAKPGGARQLVSDIHDKLMDFADLLSKSEATSEEAQEAGALISQFQALVDKLGQAPGAKKPAAAQAPGSVPMEAGAADVKPAL